MPKRAIQDRDPRNGALSTDQDRVPRNRQRWIPSSGWDALALSVGFLAVQSRFLPLPYIYDPIEYFFIASRLEEAGAFHRSLRIGLTIPVRLAQEAFGYSEAAYYFLPFLAGVGLTVSVYYLGRNLFSRSVGIVSAAVLMISPLVLSFSAQLWPDLPSAAAVTGAFSLLVAAGVRYKAASVLDWQGTLMLVLSGLLFGWAYLIREFIVILFPVAILIVLLYRLPARAYFYLGAAALVMFGAEVAWGWWRYQDPFIRIADVLTGNPSELAIERVRQLPASTDSAVTKLTTLPRILGLDLRGILLLVLGVFGVVSAVVTRDRGLVALAAWSVLYWSLLMAAYIYVDANGFPTLRATLPRYWYPILPPMIVGGFGAIHVVMRRFGTLRLRTLLVWGSGSLFLVLGILAVLPIARTATDPDAFHEFRRWLQREGESVSTIWTDQRTGWLLTLYTNSTFGTPIWEGSVNPINTARRFRSPDSTTGGLMVYHDTFFRTKLSGWRGAVPQGFVDPAPEWVPQYVSAGSEIVVYAYNGTAETKQIASGDDRSLVWSVEGSPSSFDDRGMLSVYAKKGSRTVVTAAEAHGAAQQDVGEVLDHGAIRVSMDIRSSETVWIEFQCSFATGDGPVKRAKGTTLYHPAHHAESIEYVCKVPTELESRVQALPRLVVTGEGEIELGAPDIDWFATDS